MGCPFLGERYSVDRFWYCMISYIIKYNDQKWSNDVVCDIIAIAQLHVRYIAIYQSTNRSYPQPMRLGFDLDMDESWSCEPESTHHWSNLQKLVNTSCLVNVQPKSTPQLGFPRIGFMEILLLVLRLRPGGLLVGGPPCSTWVFINRGTSRRSKKRVLGDTKRKCVADELVSWRKNTNNIFPIRCGFDCFLNLL